ncbi:MAG: sigma-70 family RNA polymerase sigma factor [Candidatus Brocadiia bacterium]
MVDDLLKLLMSTPDRDSAESILGRIHGLTRQSLVRLALARCGDAEDAEEAVNTAFLALWKEWAKRATGATSQIAHGWLVTVTARRALDLARSRKSRRSCIMNADPEVLDAACKGDSPADRHKALNLLYESVEELPEEQREAVVLFLADIPTAAAAVLLDVSPGTVRNRLEDARNALAKILESKGLTLVAAIATLVALSEELAAEPPQVPERQDAHPEEKRTCDRRTRVPLLLVLLLLVAVGALLLYPGILFNPAARPASPVVNSTTSPLRIPFGGWHRTFGGPGIDNFNVIAPTIDGGIIAGGSTTSVSGQPPWINDDSRPTPNIGQDWLLAKYDSRGNLMLARAWVGPEDEFITAVTPMPDGSFLVAGCSNSFGARRRNNTVLAEIGADGHLTRQIALSSPEELRPAKVIPLGDKGLMLLATASGFSTQDHEFEVALIRLDKDWKVMSARAFGGPDRDYAMNILPCTDGDWVIGGWTKSFGQGDFDFCAMRLSADLNVKWCSTWGTERPEEAGQIIPTSDGNYLMTGYSAIAQDDLDLIALKFAPDGSLLWQYKYSAPDNQSPGRALAEREGLYIFGGQVEDNSVDPATSDALLVALRSDGSIAFDRLFGGPDNDQVIASMNTPEGLLLCGTTRSFGSGMNDAWLVKLGPGFAFPADLKARPAGLKRVSGDLKPGFGEISERDVTITSHEAKMVEHEWKQP